MIESITLYNGIEMPLVGLGTWDLKGRECADMVSIALQKGYRLVDTAQMYENEEEVGEGIRKSGIDRKDIFITTKIYGISNSYEKAKAAIDISLKRMKLSYADLILLHEPYPEEAEMYHALEEALHEGRVRAIGISNYDEKRYESFLKKCRVVPMVNQMECHVLFQRQHLQELMEEKGTKLQAWSPLGAARAGITENPVLKEIGKAHHKTAVQTALRFLVQRGISVVPKTAHVERLVENSELFDFSLSKDEMIRVRSLDQNRTLFQWTAEF